MHLVNIHTLQVKEAKDETEYPYAILSHRWVKDQELLYQDMSNILTCDKVGAKKVRSFCKLVRDLNGIESNRTDHCQYAWIDTCCIDKLSSAELSEAINSMYQYYQHATICVAYLKDVKVGKEHPDFEAQFRASEWFTRCWTLQELLAPSFLVFYNSFWEELGSRNELAALVSEITSIDVAALRGIPILGYSIGQRMSWAAGRNATRREDVAYSLMGLFDVNMPMLYGEGEKAFQRLQEEILRNFDDETLFAWSWDDLPEEEKPKGHCGLLARSPDCFKSCQHLKSTILYQRSQPLQLTNRGITGELVLNRRDGIGPNGSVAFLNASFREPGEKCEEKFVVIFLATKSDDAQEWSRRPLFGLKPSSYATVSYLDVYGAESEQKEVQVRHKEKGVLNPIVLHGFDICKLFEYTPSNLFRTLKRPLRGSDIRLAPGVRWGNVSGKKRSLMSLKAAPFGPLCNIDCTQVFRGIRLIQLGFTRDQKPVCLVFDDFGWEQQQQIVAGVDDLRPVTEKIETFDATYYDSIAWTHFEEISKSAYEQGAYINVNNVRPGRQYTGVFAIKGDHGRSNRWNIFGPDVKKGVYKDQPKFSLRLIQQPSNTAGIVWGFDFFPRS